MNAEMLRRWLCLPLLAMSASVFSAAAVVEAGDAKQAVVTALQMPSQLPDLDRPDTKQFGSRDVLDGKVIGLAVGMPVADFNVRDSNGAPVSLVDLRGQAPLLVIFYRGGWCPYCNVQIREMTEAWPEFEKRGVLPVLISADKPDAAAMAESLYEIPFPVLSDPELSAHDAFQVTMTLPDNLVDVYKNYGIVLEDWNGEGHRKFAVASAFLVGSGGVVQWAHSSTDYKARPSAAQLLNMLDQQVAIDP